MASACDLEKEDISSDVDNECTKCIDLDRLVEAMKQKLTVSSKEEKVQILTQHQKVGQLKKLATSFQFQKT